MGTSTDAVLAYGYDFGEMPNFTGLEEGEYPDWMEEGGDFATDAIRRLLDANGFTERWEADGPEGYFTREREATAALGVEIETHCSDSYPMYVLAVAGTVVTASRGSSETIAALTVPDGAADRLAWAVQTLGIGLGEAQPAWLLFSYWGC